MAGSQGGAESSAPNQASAEPIVISGGGDGSISFEDFETLESVTQSTVSKPKPKAEPKKAEDKKKDAEKLSKKAHEDEKEIESEVEEESDDEKDSDKEKDKKKEPTQKVDEKKPKVLKIKTADGTEHNLPSDLPIPVTVDGKVENVSLQDLRNEYSGKTNWARKNNEFDREKKTFYTERDGLSQGLNTIADMCKNGKPMEAIFHMAEAMGADPLGTWNDVVSQVEKALGIEISDEEREQRSRDWELAYHRNSRETAKAQGEREKELSQTQTQVEAVQNLYGMDKPTFVQAYNELCAEAKRLGKDEKSITPELVGKYYFQLKVSAGVKEIVESEFATHPKVESIKRVIRKTWEQNPEWTVDYVMELAKEAFPTEKKSALARKVEKTRTREAESKSTNNEPVTWDDI